VRREGEAVTSLTYLGSPAPFFEDERVAIFCGDARDVLPTLARTRFGLLLTDPPYGIDYTSNRDRVDLPASIEGDADLAVRDAILDWWGDGPALVFGSWKSPPPAAARAALVWNKGPALGMGALDLPWKPSWETIFVLGRGFVGRRDGAVLAHPPVQSLARNGRAHPNEKPVGLLTHLLAKSPAGAVLDPCMGSGSTLVAAVKSGRQAVGIEIDEAYCEHAARRLAQGTLDL
jgi:DNA modification methylase